MKILLLLLISSSCFAQTKAVLKATATNGIVSLDVSGSTFDDKPSNPGTYYFTILPSNGGSAAQILPDNNGVRGDGKTRTFKATPGSYKIFLNIQGSNGTKDITAVDIDVPSTTTPPVIVIPPAAKDTLQVFSYYDKGIFRVKIILFVDLSVATSNKP